MEHNLSIKGVELGNQKSDLGTVNHIKFVAFCYENCLLSVGKVENFSVPGIFSNVFDCH